MGLALSKWLGRDRTRKNRPYFSSPSPFLPLAVSPPICLAVLLDTPPLPADDPKSLWSPVHCSTNFSLTHGGTVAQRAPAEQSTDGVRGAVGVQGGLHLWEVEWDPAERGSHAVVGVSTQLCPLQASGYTVLVGGDAESWGWELGSNQLWHNGVSLGHYPGKASESGKSEEEVAEERPLLAVPGRVLMVLDGDAGTLGFIVDGCFLSVAMWNLPRGVELFPAASSVRGRSQIRLHYLNGDTREPPPLVSLCRLSIRQAVGMDSETQTDRLPLPPALRRLLGS